MYEASISAVSGAGLSKGTCFSQASKRVGFQHVIRVFSHAPNGIGNAFWQLRSAPCSAGSLGSMLGFSSWPICESTIAAVHRSLTLFDIHRFRLTI